MSGPLREWLSRAQHADPRRATGGLTMDRLHQFPIVLYGAGSLGRHVLARLRLCGIAPVAFADDTASKDGTVVDGLQVVTPARAVHAAGADATFVVTIFNPGLRFLDAQARLRGLVRTPVFSFVHLGQLLPDAFLPYGFFAPRSAMLTELDAIARTYELLADAESRRQFLAHLTFRLESDFEALPANSRASYFPDELFRESFSGDVRFVDCGAYDGDTIATFLRFQQGAFSTIDAFEPDPANFSRLERFVGSLGASVSERITLHQAGVGAATARLPFQGTGDMAAAFDGSGSWSADVRALDDVLHLDERPLYIKLDIEGSERAALQGAGSVIHEAQPTLATSVYHRPADLWQLPAFIKMLNPGYRIFIRTEGEDGADVVCYALRPEG